MSFVPATPDALALGANRLLVGDEIIQFASVEAVTARRWRLTGLIRGRGGSEAEAQAGCPAGSRIVLLDDDLVAINGAQIDSTTAQVAAIGAGDIDPVAVPIDRPGRARQPLSPVHPSAELTDDDALHLRWTRRGRGAWTWADGVDVPLIEQSELYEVGVGSEMAPLAAWTSSSPSFEIPADQLAAIPSQHPAAAVWVRQIGDYAKSPSLLLTTIG